MLFRSLLNNDSFEHLRLFLLKKTALEEIIDLGPGVFQDAKNETMLFFAVRQKAKRNHRLRVIKSNNNLENLDYGNLVMQNWYSDIPKSAFLVITDSASVELLSKLRAHSLRLGYLCTINQGLRTGNNDKYISEKKKYSSHKPVVGGKNIARYRIKEHLFVQYESEKLDAPRKESIFLSDEKIIVDRKSTRLNSSHIPLSRMPSSA